MAFTTANGRTQTSIADINITPLVDVVLVLLIIFMVTAPVFQSGDRTQRAAHAHCQRNHRRAHRELDQQAAERFSATTQSTSMKLVRR